MRLDVADIYIHVGQIIVIRQLLKILQSISELATLKRRASSGGRK